MTSVDNSIERAARLAEFGITAEPMPDYTLLAEDGEQIPSFLRGLKRWLTWRFTESEAGKPTKVPDQSTLQLGRCRTYADICKQLPRSEWRSEQGGGFVMTGGVVIERGDKRANLLLVDLDGCRTPNTGELSTWAKEAISLLDHSYTEVSPSGMGLRAIVCANELPANVGAKMPLHSEQPPPGCTKKPEIQFFGLGPAGYATITGHRLRATKAGVATLQNLNAFIERFSMHGEPGSEKDIAELTGSGDAPSMEEIAARVREHEHGQELLDGHWKKVFPKKSASEAFHLLEQWVLEAARGHGDAALKFLLSTAWGRGEIDDSADPSRYTRRKWVEADLLRVARKRPVLTAADVFDDHGPAPAQQQQQQQPADEEKVSPNLGDLTKVLGDLRHDGPLVRLPTGIATLDEMTGGGFVLGSRVYAIGAPDAGKTALVVQIAHTYAASGICVGILAVDEEPQDIMLRLMQRRGIPRTDGETRSPAVLARAEEELSGLPLRLYDGTVSIEKAAAALHAFAKSRHPGVDRPPCVLIVDSIQTARAEKEDLDASLYKAVTGRVAQLRRAATRYRMLVISTSEMNRGAYKSKKVDEQTTDMAAAKESGAIEFSARVLLSLRSVPAQSDLVELRVVKNKHGLSHRAEQDGIFLRVDREAQQLVEDAEFEPLDVDEARASAATERSNDDCAKLADLLLTHADGLGVNQIKAAMKLLTPPVPPGRADDARNALLARGALVEVPAPRGSKVSKLVLAKVPAEVRSRMAQGSDLK